MSAAGRMMQRALAQVDRDAARHNIEYTPEERAEAAQELFHDWMADYAREREEIEDTPCLENFNCDDAGTGEGRYHGRIA